MFLNTLKCLWLKIRWFQGFRRLVQIFPFVLCVQDLKLRVVMILVIALAKQTRYRRRWRCCEWLLILKSIVSFFVVIFTKPYLTMLPKFIMTELLYRCNCSKAKATFALRRDLVINWRSSSRSDEDIDGIMKPAYRRPSQGSRWFFVEAWRNKESKQLDPQFRKPPGWKDVDILR